MFGIYLHETNVKTSRLIKTFGNKLEALGFMEETVEDFITHKDGEERGKQDLIKEPSSYKSMRWGSLPYGFFKTRNTDESLHRMTVWHKIKKKGYIYNSYEILKVFSIDLIYLPESVLDKEITQKEALETIFYHYDSEDCEPYIEEAEKTFKNQLKAYMNYDVLPLINCLGEESIGIIEDHIEENIENIEKDECLFDEEYSEDIHSV